MPSSDALESQIRVALREWRTHMAQGSGPPETIDPAHDHVRGDITAPVVIIEYGSLGSRGESNEDQALRRKLHAWLDEGRICLVFRHFPLIDSSPAASVAARAVEAAAFQGRFWDLHDSLTDTLTSRSAKELDATAIRAAARHLKLDLARLEADMESASIATKILRDLHSGARSGVNGAPTFYVQGVRQDIEDPDDLVERIEYALAGDLAALWPPLHKHVPAGNAVGKIDIVHAWHDGLAEGDISTAAASWDDGISWRGWNQELPGGGTATGRIAVEDLHSLPRTMPTDFRIDVHEYIEDGDRLLVLGDAHGDAPGGSFHVPYVQIWEFDAGKAKRVATLTDTLAIANALVDPAAESEIRTPRHP